MRPRTRLLVIPAAAALLLAGAGLAFLRYGLTPIVRSKVLPRVNAALGLRIDLARAVAYPTRVAGAVEGLTVDNPAGIQEPRVLTVAALDADLRLWPLFRRTADMESVEIRDARLTIARNAKGDVNLGARLAAAGSPPALPAPTGAPPAAVKQPPAPTHAPGPSVLPAILIERLAADGVVEYVDRRQRATPGRIGFRFDLAADGIGTRAPPNDEWGKVSLTGHLDGSPDLCRTAIEGRLAPLADPHKPSFDLRGTVARVDLARLAAVFTNIEAQADDASIDLRLSCRDGAFVKSDSVITARLVNLRLTGKLGRNVPGAVFRQLTVPIHVGGPLANPDIGWAKAVTEAVLESVARDPDTLVKLIGAGGSALSTKIDKLTGKLGGKRSRAPTAPAAVTNAPPVTPASDALPAPAPAATP